jgi:hypothetical protein
MPRRQRAASFENCVPPDIASNYRRLGRDDRVAEVVKTLRRRGMTDKTVEILFRNIASIPREWQSDNEPWKHGKKRRNRLSKKLRDLAREISLDPDLGGWCFQIAAEHLNARPEHRNGMRTLAGLLHEAAVFLEPRDKLLKRMSNGEILSLDEFERRLRPTRRVPRAPYALLAIFELLRVYTLPLPNKRSEPRALNKETEILASVLLQREIKPGTVTQLRKKDRRRYARDK